MKSNKFTIDGIEYSEKEYYEQHATEEEFLQWYKTLDLPVYEKPSVTVDNVILARDPKSDKIKMLMIKRKAHPFKDCWALPGGFVDKNESTTDSAIREVKEETNVTISQDNISQLHTFSSPDRDPRGWTISVAHIIELRSMPEAIAGDDAKEIQWFEIDVNDVISNEFILTGERDDSTFIINKDNQNCIKYHKIAFDHSSIIYKALQSLQ